MSINATWLSFRSNAKNMKRKTFPTIASLLLPIAFTGLGSFVFAQNVHTVQSTAPELGKPSQELPAGAPGTGIQSQTPSAIGEAQPAEEQPPATSGETQITLPALSRALTPAEIEEMKDGK